MKFYRNEKVMALDDDQVYKPATFITWEWGVDATCVCVCFLVWDSNSTQESICRRGKEIRKCKRVLLEEISTERTKSGYTRHAEAYCKRTKKWKHAYTLDDIVDVDEKEGYHTV